MIRTLLKKQLAESFAWFYFSAKSGKRRSARGILAFGVLYLLLFGLLGFIFFALAKSLCAPLVSAGLDWLFFAIMGLIAVFLGVFGSVFNTYASLYLAKDNDILLSMPISPSKILIMRLSGVYIMGLMYELTVMVPTLLVWFLDGKAGVLGVLFSILITFVLSFFVLTLSCILGWVVAFFGSRFRNKSFISVILFVLFIAAYYFVYFKANELLTGILINPQVYADKAKAVLYPLYHMGKAASGNVLSMLVFTAMIAVLFFLVYSILSHSFFKLATMNKGSTAKRYKEKSVREGNAFSALFFKELRRFASSATYMMNCALGVLILPVAAVAVFIKGKDIALLLTSLFASQNADIPALLAAASVCLAASMIDISAPSVSLEGKNIWLVQTLPVSSWQVLRAKLALHLVFALPASALLTAALLIAFKPSFVCWFLVPVTVFLFILLTAALGLALNLKSPNLAWTSETVPVKQSMSVTVALFGGWGIVTGLGLVYFLLADFISPAFFLSVVCVLFLIVDIFLLSWLKNKGSRIFENL